MAEPPVRTLLDRLTQSIILKADLLKRVEDEVRWIEEELDLTVPQFEPFQAPADFHYWIERVGNVIHEAEGLIETYAKKNSKSRAAAIYKKPIYWIELWRLGKEMKRIRYENIHVRDWFSRLNESDVMPETRASNASNTSVPSHLKQCIYYFLLFPANFEVPTRRLLSLWVVEGLVRPKKYVDESAEHIADRYLKELIDLDVVHVTKKKRNGKVKACQLKDGTRDRWLVKAKEDKFLPAKTEDILRLVDHNSIDDISSIQISHGNSTVSHSVPKYRDVISFFSFDTQEGSKPGEDIGDFLHKCISAGCFVWRLKVLDLEQVFRPKLPKKLGKLIGLKYLGLRWTYLEQLPDFVNKLLNLQVLDVKHTYISVLPKSIWSMEYLRHLYLSEAYRTRFPDRPSQVSLTALQTLWGAFVDENTCVEGGLDTLRNIRKLGLSCRSRPSQGSKMLEKLKAVDKWISNLKFLESLRLKSRDERGKAAALHLCPLSGNTNLSTVYLLGKLDPNVLSEFPVSLTDITLSGSELDLDPMEFLGRLPNLQILRLWLTPSRTTRCIAPEKVFLSLKFFVFGIRRIWRNGKQRKDHCLVWKRWKSDPVRT